MVPAVPRGRDHAHPAHRHDHEQCAPDLYAVLGLAPSATQDQLAHAYRVLLRQHHPDSRGLTDDSHATDDSHGLAADAVLQQILAAYTVLRDPTRRADYDRHATLRRPERTPQHTDAARPAPDPRCPPPIRVGPLRWHPH